MSARRGRRPLGLTGLFYALLVTVVAVDLWGVFFWARVEGGIGSSLAVVGVAVAVALLSVLGHDVVRQWSARDESGSTTSSAPG